VSVDGGDRLATIAARVSVCTDCELHRGRTMSVPGAGSSTSNVMFIGEAPGMNEDKQGLPFIGNAGKFLDDMLASIEWSRDDVFVTNIVKCRPPGNRDPLPDEIHACSAYLDGQIEALNPLLIVTLGRYSMARWFANERISRIHGKHRAFGQRVVVPMYHPAAALHQPSLRAVIQADFKKLPLILEEAKQSVGAGDEEATDAEQMKLF
jgi:uracil-DNA glycosylase